MLAQILDARVPVVASPVNGALCGYISEGTEVKLGKASNSANGNFIYIEAANGIRGFIPGATRVIQFRPARLLKDSPRCEQPNASSAGLLRKGELIFLVTGSNRDGWVQIRTKTGEYAYIPANTRISIQPDNPRAAGAKQIVIGLILLAAGLAATSWSMSSASNGGTYLIFYGPVIYGIALVFQGFIRLLLNR